MIRVIVEFVPSRHAERAKEVARLEIYNHDRHDSFSDYVVRGAVTDLNGDTKLFNRMVYDFTRLRWNVLGLLLAALQAIGPDMMRNEGAILDDGG